MQMQIQKKKQNKSKRNSIEYIVERLGKKAKQSDSVGLNKGDGFSDTLA